MIERVVAEYKDLLGGVNQEVPASAIADNEHSMAVNWKPVGKRIQQRGGLRRLFTYAPSGIKEYVMGMRVASRASVVGGVVVLGSTHASWYDPGWVSSNLIGTIGTGAIDPWSIAGWNDAIFAARESDGMKIIQLYDGTNPDFVGAAGAAAPTAALTAADNGAAGSPITGGNYIYVYAWRDPRTGTTSSYSPVSNTVAVTAAHSVLLSGFGVPPSARFTQVVIGRSLPNGTGAYYQLATATYSLGMTYTDIISLQAQGAALSSTNDVPASNVKSVIYWNGRIWALTDQLVYPSGILSPEAFSALDALEVGSDDTEQNVDFVATPNKIIVGKRRSIWSISGTGATSWDIRLVDGQHGVTSPRSMFYQNGAVFYKSDDDFYATDGSTPSVPLSGVGARKLAPFFTALNTADPVPVVGIPGSDGVLFGMNSRALIREEEEVVAP